jgi:peroxiredoxin
MQLRALRVPDLARFDSLSLQNGPEHRTLFRELQESESNRDVKRHLTYGLETGDVGYPLLLDPAFTVSATYGVAFQMRIHTELSNRPATFLIDRQGVLRYQRRAKTFADRPTVAEILSELGSW